MLSTFAPCLLALVPLAFISSTHAVTHDVTVGGVGVLAFTPESIVCPSPPFSPLKGLTLELLKTAAVGDTVVFTFKQSNHTATQSTLDAPCVKMNGGFDSGLYVNYV